MYVIIWEYQVNAEHSVEFEKIYSVTGAWADLFHKQKGYLGTELLHDPQDREWYITIDRWASRGDYESFLSQWKIEYQALDTQCEGLTEQETLLGEWKTIDQEKETR
jgi:heme-degrading monooxygenase HmoA